jgi:predicted RNA-binding Zn ribbon-like protein
MTERRDFEFSAGALCFDLVDTVSGRGRGDIELLGSPDDLDRWRKAAGFSFEMKAPDVRDLAAARRLREAIRNAGLAAISGEQSPGDVALINAFARRTPPRPQLVGSELVYRAANGVQAIFAAVAEDALKHLHRERRHRIRACPSCAMLFFDNSPPGKRRWCSSRSACGNREKVRRHRQARKAGETAEALGSAG